MKLRGPPAGWGTPPYRKFPLRDDSVPWVMPCHTAASFYSLGLCYETQDQSLGMGVPLCAAHHLLSIRIRHLSDSLRPLEDHFAFSRDPTRYNFPIPSSCSHAALTLHLLLAITHEICMRFYPVDASATHIQKGHPLPPRFQQPHHPSSHPRHITVSS